MHLEAETKDRIAILKEQGDEDQRIREWASLEQRKRSDEDLRFAELQMRLWFGRPWLVGPGLRLVSPGASAFQPSPMMQPYPGLSHPATTTHGYQPHHQLASHYAPPPAGCFKTSEGPMTTAQSLLSPQPGPAQPSSHPSSTTTGALTSPSPHQPAVALKPESSSLGTSEPAPISLQLPSGHPPPPQPAPTSQRPPHRR